MVLDVLHEYRPIQEIQDGSEVDIVWSYNFSVIKAIQMFLEVVCEYDLNSDTLVPIWPIDNMTRDQYVH